MLNTHRNSPNKYTKSHFSLFRKMNVIKSDISGFFSTEVFHDFEKIKNYNSRDTKICSGNTDFSLKSTHLQWSSTICLTIVS